jgi:hypothetical protein
MLLLGGMALKALLRAVGALLLLWGIYLIFSDSGFLGAIAIIIACLLFPAGKGGSRNVHSYDHDDDHHDDERDDIYPDDSSGGDSGGGDD